MITTKSKEGVRAIRATKYKTYIEGRFTHARAPLAQKYTYRIFESKVDTKKYETLNKIERHNFCLKYLFIKSNRTALQTYNCT